MRILNEAVVDAVKLSHRYISGRQLPDKSVSLLDTTPVKGKPDPIEIYRVIGEDEENVTIIVAPLLPRCVPRLRGSSDLPVWVCSPFESR